MGWQGLELLFSLTIDHPGLIAARIFMAFFTLEATSVHCLVAPERRD